MFLVCSFQPSLELARAILATGAAKLVNALRDLDNGDARDVELVGVGPKPVDETGRRGPAGRQQRNGRGVQQIAAVQISISRGSLASRSNAQPPEKGAADRRIPTPPSRRVGLRLRRASPPPPAGRGE